MYNVKLCCFLSVYLFFINDLFNLQPNTNIIANAVDGSVQYSHTAPNQTPSTYFFNIKSGKFETRDEELNLFVVNGDGSIEVRMGGGGWGVERRGSFCCNWRTR